jgi:hypothetical protein
MALSFYCPATTRQTQQAALFNSLLTVRVSEAKGYASTRSASVQTGSFGGGHIGVGHRFFTLIGCGA